MNPIMRAYDVMDELMGIDLISFFLKQFNARQKNLDGSAMEQRKGGLKT